MTDASESIDLDELEKFTDQWANNPHNGDTIYSLAWMEGPESARTEASATLTVSGLLALVARVREAERLASVRRDTIATYERENADWERRVHEAERRIEKAKRVLIHPNRIDEYGEIPLRDSVNRARQALTEGDEQ